MVAGAALAVSPLALITGTFISHDVIPKVILLTTGAALLLLFLSQWAAGVGSLRQNSAGKQFFILILAQFTSLVLSTLFSTQFSLSLAGTVWRRFGLVEQTAVLIIATAVASLVAFNPSSIGMLFRAVAICGGLAATYGILQYFSLDPFIDRSLYAVEYFGGVARPPSTMGHALYFSGYLVVVLFIAISLALHERAPAWKRVGVAAAALSGIAIVLTGTRSALLAVIGAGGLFIWRAVRGRKQRVSLKLLWAAALASTAMAVFIFSPAGANLRHRIAQWQTETGGPRLQMWRESPALISEHPVLGAGPETFAGEFRKIQSVKLSREYPDFYNETPHNALIDAACAQGIPGALILVCLFASVWSPSVRNVSAKPLMWGIEAAMLGLLIGSMFASLILVTSLYLWSLAGMAAAITPATEPERNRRAPALLRVSAAAVAFFFLAAAAILGLQDAAWMNLGRSVANKDIAGAEDAYSGATLFGSWIPGYELWASREWALLGRSLGNSPDGAAAWRMAASAASQAEVGSEERFSAAYQSSVLAVAAGDLPRAESEARKTIGLAPNWYKGHLLLSQILQIAGKYDAAAREAQRSRALGWTK